MAEYHKYSIRKNRFRRSFLSGLECIGDTVLKCDESTYRRVFISDAIDGTEDEAKWGRLHIDYDLSEDMVITVYALSADNPYVWVGEREMAYIDILHDESLPMAQKRNFMEQMGAKKSVNKSDVLLYDIEGRYLFILIDIYGYGKGEIKDMFVDNQGDIFMNTFPEVYREYGSFFHRYMSVFSSVYLDFQKKIDNVYEFIDVDKAPAELLPVFAKWMGLDISGGFLQEDRMRPLVKETYKLNRIKGTKEALERVAEIILGEKVIILEKNVIRDNTQAVSKELYESLYGDGIYDVTMLVKTYVPENAKLQLMFILNQFKPVRSRLKMRFLEEKGDLDGHTYMDMNAFVTESRRGILDERMGLDNSILLEE